MADSSIDDLFGGHDQDPDRGRRRARRREKTSPLKAFAPIVLVLVVILALGAGGVFGYHWISHNVNITSEPKDFEGEGTEPVTITVNEGDSGSDIARTLVDAGVIKSSGPFVQAFAANPEASKIVPGSYKLKKQMNSASALELLLDPASFAGIRVTFPEGQRAEQMYARASEATGIPVEDFEKAAKDYKARGVPENPAKSIEGYLWPGTYDFEEDQTAEEILEEMVARMKSKLEQKGVDPKEWHKTLTIASIAEKEARAEEDYGKVVRTIDNRLSGLGEANGHPMRLQLDSTVAYFNGLETVSTTSEQRAKDSPYNTYLHEGLPIGPIANPGDATLDATLNPPKGKWLYWVTVNTDTGETKFAETKAEHDKNVREWREWARNK